VLLWALVALASDALAKPFDPAGSDWESVGDFVQMARDDLGEARVVVAARLDLHDLKREDGVILLHPERMLDADELAAFMRAGGRVVLLDDYGTGDVLLQHFGIQRVPMPLHPAEMLRNNPELAIAEPASAHPVVRDVSRVVTNHATGLRHPDLSPVLRVRGNDEPDVLVAEAGAVGQGRFLAVGDPSILINTMLRYPGNRAFARALVRYVTDDDTWGKRGGRLFILSGDFEQKGSFGDSGGFGDMLSDWKRQALDALEGVRKGGMPPAASYIVSVLLGLAIIVWVGSRAGKTHRASPPRFVRAIPTVAQGGVAGHAAVVGAPSTSRVLAMLEIKSALEEDLCTMLGLEEAPGSDALVDKARAAGLLDGADLRALKSLFATFAAVENMLALRHARGVDRIRDRDVVAAASRVHELLEKARARAEHGAFRGAGGFAAAEPKTE
jgi:hypothetical protein